MLLDEDKPEAQLLWDFSALQSWSILWKEVPKARMGSSTVHSEQGKWAGLTPEAEG